MTPIERVEGDRLVLKQDLGTALANAEDQGALAERKACVLILESLSITFQRNAQVCLDKNNRSAAHFYRQLAYGMGIDATARIRARGNPGEIPLSAGWQGSLDTSLPPPWVELQRIVLQYAGDLLRTRDVDSEQPFSLWVALADWVSTYQLELGVANPEQD